MTQPAQYIAENSPEGQRSLAERIIADPQLFGIEKHWNVQRIVYGNFANVISWDEVGELIQQARSGA